MKLLIMPTAIQIRNGAVDHKKIVAKVLKCRPEIEAKRKEVVKIASIMRAEFTHERESMDEFRYKIKDNIHNENEKQKEKYKKLKEKYDKEGVEIIEDESQIGNNAKVKSMTGTRDLGNLKDANEIHNLRTKDNSNLVYTKSGKSLKPGGGKGTGSLKEDLDLGRLKGV